MFRATFANQELLCATVAWPELQRSGKPIPPIAQRANSFYCPTGPEPARGWVFMRRASLDLLDLNATGSLTFNLEDDSGASTTLSFVGLVVAKEPLCLTPSYIASDPKAMYLVELSDARLTARMTAISKEYNIRAPFADQEADASQYYYDSLNAGAVWTWQTMVSDIWTIVGLSGSDTLPVSPHGTPEGFSFRGMSAYEALNGVLERIGCTLCPNPLTGNFSIVQLGAAETPLASITNVLIHDGDYLVPNRGRLPFGVKVYFHKRTQAGPEVVTGRVIDGEWELPEPYVVTVNGGYVGSLADTYTAIWDDLPALYDVDGALLNETALDDRAAERATDYYRMLTTGGEKLWKVYSGLVGIGPSSTIKGVSWRETPGESMLSGVVTEFTRHPAYRIRVDDSGQWEECCAPKGLTYGAGHWLANTRKDDNQLMEWVEVEDLITATFEATEADDTFTATGHGLNDDEEIKLISPSPPDALPDGVTAGIAYYVIKLDADTFKLSETIGGSAIDITTDGTGSFVRTFNGFLYWPGPRLNCITPTDFTNGEDVWIVDPDGNIPKVGERYLARRIGKEGPADDKRALYSIDVPDCCEGPNPFANGNGGGGGTPITCSPCSDDGSDSPIAWDLTFPTLAQSAIHDCTGCDHFAGQTIRLTALDPGSPLCEWCWTSTRTTNDFEATTSDRVCLRYWDGESSYYFPLKNGIAPQWQLVIELGFLSGCRFQTSILDYGAYYAELEPVGVFDCQLENDFQLKGPLDNGNYPSWLFYNGAANVSNPYDRCSNDSPQPPTTVPQYSELGYYWCNQGYPVANGGHCSVAQSALIEPSGLCDDYWATAPCNLSGTVVITPVFA